MGGEVNSTEPLGYVLMKIMVETLLKVFLINTI
jgi:hypothetical protein